MVSSSPSGLFRSHWQCSLGIPVVSYHFLAAGPVLGNFHQVSISWGRSIGSSSVHGGFHQEGSTAGLSTLWSGGLMSFTPKPIVRERRVVIPALSVVRSLAQECVTSGRDPGPKTRASGLHAVATKTFTGIRKLPLVFNAGFKVTNASLLGLRGNAPGYYASVSGRLDCVQRPGRSTYCWVRSSCSSRAASRDAGAVYDHASLRGPHHSVGCLPLHGWGVETPKLP